MAIEVFNRREIKYMLTAHDREALLAIIPNYMDCDSFNKDGSPYKICNLYLDTDSDELIRKSLEKPAFKEKIRLRSVRRIFSTCKDYFRICSEKYSFVTLATTPERIRRAIRFGIAIKPFKVSAISHMSVPEPTAPTMQTRANMIL